MTILNKLLIALLTLTLASCSLLSPVPDDSQHKYVLSSVPAAQHKKPRQQITLLVAQPSTNSLYNTKLIAYSTAPYQIGYFAKSMWISKPSDMLQPLIVQALQNTHYYHAVISPSIAGGYQYSLNTQIEELLQDYTQGQAVIHFTVRAQIVRTINNKVIASKQFDVIEPIQKKCPYAGIYATNRATAEILRQLTEFCLKKT